MQSVEAEHDNGIARRFHRAYLSGMDLSEPLAVLRVVSSVVVQIIPSMDPAST